MHVIDGLPWGGAERMLVDIANATVATGCRVSACVTRSRVDMACCLDRGIRLHLLKRQRRFELQPLLKFLRIVRKEKVDLLHAHSRSTFSMLALLRALFQLQLPVVLHDHYGSIEQDNSVPPWFRFAGRLLLDHYVGVYGKLSQWAEHAGVPRTRIDVIGNAIDFSRIESGAALNLKQAFGIPPADRVGIVVAGIRPDKGIDILLQALALEPLPSGIKLLVIGADADPSYAAMCRDLARTLERGDVAMFVGPRQDVPAIAKAADFGVIPSRTESGPLVLIEYLAASLPVVSTLVGDIARRSSQCGVSEFVPPNDALALRHAIDRLLALPPEERRVRGKLGRRVAVDQFDIRQVVGQWIALYQRLLRARQT